MAKGRTKPKHAPDEATIDMRVLKALGHPLRQRMLRVLNGRIASATDIAEDLGEPTQNVAYHMRILLENEAVELVKSEPRRGALEHYYRPTRRPFLESAELAAFPPSSRQSLSEDILRQVAEHISAAAADHGFDDPTTHLSSTRLELDEEAYRTLSEHLRETISLALRLEAESASRATPSQARQTHSTEMVLMHFHRGHDAPSGASPPRRKQSQANRHAAPPRS